MQKITSPVGYGSDSVKPNNDRLEKRANARFEEGFKPLTRFQAQALRQNHRMLSPWSVLAGQATFGLVISVATWVVTGRVNLAWSVLYGAVAVVLPGAVFARGLMSKVSSINPAAAVTGFFLWETMKVGLVLAMLFAAPKIVQDLSWPAMLVGLIVTMKIVWLVLWVVFRLQAKTQRKSKEIIVVRN